MVKIPLFALLSFTIPSTCYRLRVTTTSWVLPLETSNSHQLEQGKSSNPSPPIPTLPPWPEMHDVAGLKRGTTVSVGTNTCGWVNTELGLSVICNTGSTCTNSATYRQCCSGAACTTSSFATACLAATAQACSAKTGHDGTMCCTHVQEAPYCATYLWSTTATPGTVFTYYGCDLMKDAGVQIIQPTPPAMTSSSTSTTSSSTISSTSVSSVNSTAPASSSSAVSSAPVASENSSSSQVPIGAIVGGSIGGAAVVGLFVLGVLFIIHKQKRAAQQGDKDSARGSGDDFQRNTGNPGDWQQDAGHMDHWHYQQPMAEAPQGDNNVLSSELSAIGRPSEMQGDLRKAYHDRAELY